ncbi:MAG: extracellular solute-binding protein [Acidisphaera sp.]|nr:extracellular solute-binding protein [Acidisphaera sp.]
MHLTRRAVTFGSLAMGGAALGPRQAAAQTGAQMGAQTGAQQSLYEAAKKEGQVAWYSGILDQPLCDRVGAAFTQQHPGIRVNAIKTTSEVAFQRVMQDLNGGAVQADVFTTTDASHMSYLVGKGQLVKYVPENAKGMVPALQNFDPQGYYHVSWVGLVTIVYNAAKVKPEDAPKDWMDLTDPKWKNQICFGSPNYSGLIGDWTVAMTEKYKWEYFEKLNKLNPLIGRSIDDAVTTLNSGERMVAAGNPASSLRSAAKGNPLAVNYPTSFTVADFSPSAILKGSRSPNAAKLFMEFLAGPEYSKILTDSFEQSLRADVPPPHGAKSLTELTVFMPTLANIEKELPGCKSRWRDTFGT